MTDAATRKNENRLLAFLGCAAFLMQWVPNLIDGYGYFIDEFYYLACTERLAWGYVDHPPLSIFILKASRLLFGDSLPALRLLSSLSAGLAVFLTGLMARRMGAGAFGQGLAAAALMLGPVPMVLFGFYSMNAFEVLLWVTACYVLVEIARTGNERLWIRFGLVAGLGLLNKHTFVMLAVGLAIGVVLTPLRRHLTSRYLWLGVGLAAVLVMPNILWQVHNGWPSLEFYRNADALKNVPTPPLKVLLEQTLLMNPISAVLWIGGLLFCLRSEHGRPFRFLGWMFLALILLAMIGQKSRPDRLAGLYPVMFAAGATLWESLRFRRGLGWIRYAVPVLMVVVGLVMAPIGLAVLPPAQLATYAATTGIVPKIEAGEGKVSPLPQWFADRHGWEQMVEEVTAAVDSLTAGERAQAIILAPSYGHAGALELLGEDLPPVISPQNTYYLWATEETDMEGKVLISIGYENSLSDYYEEVERFGVSNCHYCMSWRNNMPITIARHPTRSLREAWPQLKNFQ
jgi:hypothetical protein